ncbi:MAG: four helix bundle protein [Pseudomonadota bacterium]
MANSYRELDVWKLGIDQCTLVYRLTEGLPKEEKYGLCAQMRRTAVSIPASIAEGSTRQRTKENLHFVSIAYSSNTELETYFILCENLSLLDTGDLTEIRSLNEHFGKKLAKYYQSLQK